MLTRRRCSGLVLATVAGCQTPAPPPTWSTDQVPMLQQYLGNPEYSVVRARIARVTPTRFALSAAEPDGEVVSLRVLAVDWSECLQERELVDLYNVPAHGVDPRTAVPVGLLRAGEVRHVVVHHARGRYPGASGYGMSGSGVSGHGGDSLTLAGPAVGIAADDVMASAAWGRGAECVGHRHCSVVRARVVAVKTVRVRDTVADHVDLEVLAVEWSDARWQPGLRIRAGDARGLTDEARDEFLISNGVPVADPAAPVGWPVERLAPGEERWLVVDHVGFVKLIRVASEPLRG